MGLKCIRGNITVAENLVLLADEYKVHSPGIVGLQKLNVSDDRYVRW